LSVLSKKITALALAAGAGQTACLSVLSKKFCQGAAQETGEKKRPLSRAFPLATDCGELLGD
tara:strand:- start:4742 stop:4927 length:186 start_codon:yes stop_codon:yes gene_type:complete